VLFPLFKDPIDAPLKTSPLGNTRRHSTKGC
jgi:hypothetical protein